MTQETLEEAALKHCDMLDKFPALINTLFSFKEGAKWQQDNSNINALNFEIDALKKQIELLKYQQEKMYSEEDMEIAWDEAQKLKTECMANGKDKKCYCTNEIHCQHKRLVKFSEWFEQFKNK